MKIKSPPQLWLLLFAITTLFFSCSKKDLTATTGNLADAGASALSRTTTKTLLYSGFDNSGKVEVKIWADYVDGQHPHAEVSVDNDFVMIGGGARVSDFNNSSNSVLALLTSCYPKDDGTFTTFVADSKDHITVYNHRLWVYVIGMKLYDGSNNPISTSTLISQMSIAKATSSSAAHPSVTVNAMPSGYKVLSGGAKVNWSGAGNLLTKSNFPTTGATETQWEANSKDHGISSPATIEAYELSIDPVISNFGTLEVMYKYGAVNTNNNYMTVSQNTYYPGPPAADNLLLAGIGGWSQYTGAGRLLFAIYPTSLNGAEVRSKDHQYGDQSGSLSISIVMIRKQ
jgi:hypothetical protein